MRIEPRFLGPRLREAAIDQTAARLERQGYLVSRAAAVGGTTADLVASRDGERIVYEFKLSEADEPDWRERVSRLRAETQAVGARFRLMLVHMPGGTEVQVSGIDQALGADLEKSLQRHLDSRLSDLTDLAPRSRVQGVSDVVIHYVQLGEDGRARLKGEAIVTGAFFGWGDQPEIVESFPFSFDVTLHGNGHLTEESPPVVDTSSWWELDGVQ